MSAASSRDFNFDEKGRPKLLDLFCGAGGATKGYQSAGFYVVGVDVVPQPEYCGDEFVQADALEYLAALHPRTGMAGPPIFDAIHASPPCQAHSSLNGMWNAGEHLDLIPQTRTLLQSFRVPWVIENVPGAPLIDPVTICGASVGLGVDGYKLRRHRLFESNVSLMVPPCACDARPTVGIYGDKVRDRRRNPNAKNPESGTDFSRTDRRRMAQEAMEMPWASWRGLTQAIPPAYTELIGAQLIQVRCAA